MRTAPGDAPLYRWERAGLWLFALFVIAFGVLTEIRSCLQSQRRTDFGMLARAGWAVRSGIDIYSVTDDGGLHYPYPAAFAIAMVPLADPPPGADRSGYLPFAVSVALWYLLSIAAVGYAAHTLASAVLPDARAGTRRWWYARTVPVYVCLTEIAFSLGRGQVTLILLALIAAGFAALIRGRHLRGGAWLGAAVVVKLIPAYLLLYPFVRRDWRAGFGVAAALGVGIAVIPVIVWGPAGAIEKHQYFWEHVVVAGTTEDASDHLGHELTKVTSSDNQSIVAAIHNITHFDLPKDYRPPRASLTARLAHWGFAGAWTLVAVYVGLWRLSPSATDQLVYFGCICALMLVVTPMSHRHYYAFGLPLAAGLWLRELAARPGAAVVGGATSIVLVFWAVITALPLLPEPFIPLREIGIGMAATVLLLGYGLWVVGRPTVCVVPVASELPESRWPRTASALSV